jgi:hypothetical protein
MNLQLLDHNPRKKMILQIELLLLTIKKEIKHLFYRESANLTFISSFLMNTYFLLSNNQSQMNLRAQHDL